MAAGDDLSSFPIFLSIPDGVNRVHPDDFGAPVGRKARAGSPKSASRAAIAAIAAIAETAETAETAEGVGRARRYPDRLWILRAASRPRSRAGRPPR